jgi:hypothetical protein
MGNYFGSLESTKVSFGAERQEASRGDGYCFMFELSFRRSSSSAFKARRWFETSCSVPFHVLGVFRAKKPKSILQHARQVRFEAKSQDVIYVTQIEGLHSLEDYWNLLKDQTVGFRTPDWDPRPKRDTNMSQKLSLSPSVIFLPVLQLLH